MIISELSLWVCLLIDIYNIGYYKLFLACSLGPLGSRAPHCGVCGGRSYSTDVSMSNVAGVVDKLSNHTTEFGSTDALASCNSLLVSSGYDLDNGFGYVNGESIVVLLVAILSVR